MNWTNMATGVVVLAARAGLAGIGGIRVCTFQNDSGHTGLDPYMALALFTPVAVTGTLHLVLLRGSGAGRWCAVCAILVGIAGAGLLVYPDRSNALLQYEVWVEKGMPWRAASQAVRSGTPVPHAFGLPDRRGMCRMQWQGNKSIPS